MGVENLHPSPDNPGSPAAVASLPPFFAFRTFCGAENRARLARARIWFSAAFLLPSAVFLDIYPGDVVADQFFYIPLDRAPLLFGMVFYDFLCAFFDVQPYGVIIPRCILVCRLRLCLCLWTCHIDHPIAILPYFIIYVHIFL